MEKTLLGRLCAFKKVTPSMEGRHKIQLECYSFEMGYNVFITSVGVRTLYVFVKYKMFFPGINMKV